MGWSFYSNGKALVAYCPNCSNEVAISATSCSRCNADFGPTSAWRPTSSPASGNAHKAGWKVDEGKGSYLWARICATAGLLYGLITAATFLIVFTTLSIPIGIGNSPLLGWLWFAAAYIVLVLYGLYECWTKPPYTRFVLVLAVAPLVLTFISPLLALVVAAR